MVDTHEASAANIQRNHQAMEMVLADARQAPRPMHQMQLPKGSLSALDACSLQTSAASSSNRVWSERRWRRIPAPCADQEFDQDAEQFNDQSVDDPTLMQELTSDELSPPGG